SMNCKDEKTKGIRLATAGQIRFSLRISAEVHKPRWHHVRRAQKKVERKSRLKNSSKNIEWENWPLGSRSVGKWLGAKM
ncbi:MAG: hypothetical protein ACKO9Q_23415, partial [Pirellula sp.]